MLKTDVLEMCDKLIRRTLDTEKGGEAQSEKLKTDNYGMHTSRRVI